MNLMFRDALVTFNHALHQNFDNAFCVTLALRAYRPRRAMSMRPTVYDDTMNEDDVTSMIEISVTPYSDPSSEQAPVVQHDFYTA